MCLRKATNPESKSKDLMNLTPTAFFSFVREFTGQVMSDNRIESVSANHQKGKVVAQIVKGNIPVQNGVIH